MTPADLDHIERLATAARPGPWTSYIEGRDHVSGSSFIMVGTGDARTDDIEMVGCTHADQDFIAAARQHVPLLVAEVRRLQAQLTDKR